MISTRPLYDARLDDLGPGDLVEVECDCGHVQLLPGSYFVSGKVPGYTRIMGLEKRLRCRECDDRGKVVVSIRWSR
jgi:hypothetical protein